MFIASFASGPWEANCYLIRLDTSSETVVVDPGVGAAGVVEQVLEERGWTLAGVLCTHGHVDHVADAAKLANTAEVPLWMHSGDDFMLTKPSAGLGAETVRLMQQLFGEDELPAPVLREDLAGVSSVTVAGIEFGVTHAPGHSPGCVVFTTKDDDGDVAFVGDLIFADAMGRVDLPGGNLAKMKDSLSRVVLAFGDDTKLLPGHGDITTAGRERARNPYLQPYFLER